MLGCEFSGTVADPNKSSFSKGDRVAGVVHGCKDARMGAFAEYVVADPSMCFHVPTNVELKEACTLSVGWISALQAFDQRLFKDEKAREGNVTSEDRNDAVSLLL